MADAAAYGVEIISEVLETPDFEVMQCNWQAVSIFLRCSTQWRLGLSGVCGLDYVALQWLFKLYAVDDSAALLEEIQVMEAEAVKILNEGNG